MTNSDQDNIFIKQLDKNSELAPPETTERDYQWKQTKSVILKPRSNRSILKTTPTRGNPSIKGIISLNLATLCQMSQDNLNCNYCAKDEKVAPLLQLCECSWRQYHAQCISKRVNKIIYGKSLFKCQECLSYYNVTAKPIKKKLEGSLVCLLGVNILLILLNFSLVVSLGLTWNSNYNYQNYLLLMTVIFLTAMIVLTLLFTKHKFIKILWSLTPYEHGEIADQKERLKNIKLILLASQYNNVEFLDCNDKKVVLQVQ